MKLNKKILPIATLTGLTALGAMAPTLSSCGKKFDYYFNDNMDVIFPTAPQAVPDAAHKDKDYEVDEARDLYLEHIEKDPSIFVQDLVRTTSYLFAVPLGSGVITFRGSASVNYKNIKANKKTHTVSGEISLICDISIKDFPKKISEEWGGYDVDAKLDNATFLFQDLEMFCVRARDAWRFGLLSIFSPSNQQNSIGKINARLDGVVSIGPQFVGYVDYEKDFNSPFDFEKLSIDLIPICLLSLLTMIEPSYHMQNIPGAEDPEAIYE